jgi:hypothetical protein
MGLARINRGFAFIFTHLCRRLTACAVSLAPPVLSLRHISMFVLLRTDLAFLHCHFHVIGILDYDLASGNDQKDDDAMNLCVLRLVEIW